MKVLYYGWSWTVSKIPDWIWIAKYDSPLISGEQSFALWQQATIDITCHDHSSHTLVIKFNRSHVNISRASMPESI